MIWDPSLIIAKNSPTLNILTPNLQESEVSRTLCVLHFPSKEASTWIIIMTRVSRVHKLRLNYRGCFLHVTTAFRDADFTFKSRIKGTWEATEAFKIISTLFGCRFVALWGHHCYVAANIQHFLLRSTSQMLVSFEICSSWRPLSAQPHRHFSKPLITRPWPPIQTAVSPFHQTWKSRFQQRKMEMGRDLLIQVQNE